MTMEQSFKDQVFANEMNMNPADIVSIYDALCSCDASKLLNAVMHIEVGRKLADRLPQARKEMLLCRLKADLEVMRNLAPCGTDAAEVLEPGQYFDTLRNLSWPQALAMNIWLPANVSEEDRYFILGQVFSAVTCGHLAKTLIEAA